MAYTNSAYGQVTPHKRPGRRGLLAAFAGLFAWLGKRAHEGGHLDPGRKV